MAVDHDGPDYFIQEAEDRQSEQQDAFDAIHPAIGGRAEGYIAAVFDGEDYLEETVDDVEAAYDAVRELVDENDLGYEVVDDPDDIVIEERDWLDD